MKTRFDDQTLAMAAKILEKPQDRLKKALNAEFNKTSENELITVKEVMAITGFSYSTLRRRCVEYGIELVTTPGWKSRRSISVQLFEERVGVKLTRSEVAK